MIENYMIEMFLLIALTVLSIIDIKRRVFPAVLTTTIILVLLLVKMDNIQFGILAFVFGWLLLELEYFSGVADLKVMTMIGLMINNLASFMFSIMIILIVGTVYTILMVKVLKFKDKIDEVPYIPVFLISYIIMLLSGLI
ncbi:MAG: hypothetical protein KAJ49_04560 [Arcobacteraceae bacterium]|nr:hypothetical protein [Arcobacteraceae bacterium]